MAIIELLFNFIYNYLYYIWNIYFYKYWVYILHYGGNNLYNFILSTSLPYLFIAIIRLLVSTVFSLLLYLYLAPVKTVLKCVVFICIQFYKNISKLFDIY